MVKVHRSTVIDAPLSAVWAIVRDFNGHDQWHPAVDYSELETEKRTDQIGAVRRFKLVGGEMVREQLLSLSDANHSFRYCILDSDLPINNYTAEVVFKPVTDGDRTFWSWSSSFDTNPGQEIELSSLVAKNIYEAGFEAVRAKLKDKEPIKTPPSKVQSDAIASDFILKGKTMVVERYGGPDVFRSIAVDVPPPKAGQIRIRQHAVGVNFIDVYCRNGHFDLLKPPASLGMEAAGEVVDVGRGVRRFYPGQQVAYACLPIGAYTSARTMEASSVVALPSGIDAITAAGGLLKGMTAEFLLHRVHPVQPKEVILVFAAAGGVGSLLCQWANHLGATVIGVTSSEEKKQAVLDAGAHHVILSGSVNLEQQVDKITDRRGVDVIYDGVGRDTFKQAVASLAKCGHLVSYGHASGDIGEWNISSLTTSSITLSRPNFIDFIDTPEKVQSITTRLFDAIKQGVLKINVNHQLPLSEAAEAHRLLEKRQTTGSIVLVPDRVIDENRLPPR